MERGGQREKERLRAEEAKAAQTARTAPAAEPGFLELVNLLAMQAAAGLGAMAGPGGERMPPDSRLAQHFIDMLDVLAKKTAGNLTDEEKKTARAKAGVTTLDEADGAASPAPC